MAKIVGANAPVTKEIDSKCEFQVNTNMNDNQKREGMLAKIQVRHPAATFIVNLWNKNGRIIAGTPSQKGREQWFPLVDLLPEVMAKLRSFANGAPADKPAWYLDMLGEHTIVITDEAVNEGLGILGIIIDSNLTQKQIDKGMVCKVDIDTTIGILRGYTIWQSTFGTDSLYGNAPSEGIQSEDGQRGNPGYRLTKDAQAQIFNYLHKQVDFTQNVPAPKPAQAVKADAEGTETDPGADSGFTPVDDEAMFAGESAGVSAGAETGADA